MITEASINLISNILKIIEDKKLLIKNVYNIITLLMILINKEKIQGDIKSNIVINVLKIIVGDKKANFESLLPPKIFTDIQLLIDYNLVQQTIDIIYDASVGKFNIGKLKSCSSSLLNCMFMKNKILK
jgi:hypothetical protein